MSVAQNKHKTALTWWPFTWSWAQWNPTAAWKSSPSEVYWGTSQRSWVVGGASLWCLRWLHFAWAGRKEPQNRLRHRRARPVYKKRGKVRHVMRMRERRGNIRYKGKKKETFGEDRAWEVWGFGCCPWYSWRKSMGLRLVLQEKAVEGQGSIQDLRVQLYVSAWWWQQHTYLPHTFKHAHTQNTVRTITFRMRYHLLWKRMEKATKEKRKDYFGVVNGEKKRQWLKKKTCMYAGLMAVEQTGRKKMIKGIKPIISI